MMVNTRSICPIKSTTKFLNSTKININNMNKNIRQQSQRVFESACIVVASAFGAGLLTIIAIIFSKL